MDEPLPCTHRTKAAIIAALLLLSGCALITMGPVSAQVDNDPPFVHAGPQEEPCAVYQDCHLIGYASDPNSDSIDNYMWDLDGDPTEYETQNPNEANQTYVFQKVGTYIATLYAMDSHGAIGDDSYEVTVVDANDPPDVTVCDDKVLHAQDWTEFTATAKDMDGILKYEWDFDGNGIYDYVSTETPNTWYRYGNKGDFKAAIRVTDDNVIPGTTIKTLNVTVYPANMPPVANAGQDMTVRAGMDIVVPGSAEDPDGTIVLYEWDTNDDGVWDVDSQANGNLHITFNQPGNYELHLRVKDDGKLPWYAHDWVNITVQPANRAPTMTAPTTLKGGVNKMVRFDATGNDPDSDPMTFSWDFDGDARSDWKGDTGTATWVYDKPGRYTAKLTATDPYGASANATVVVTIDPEPSINILGLKVLQQDSGALTILLVLGLMIGLAVGIAGGFFVGRRTMRASMINQLKEVEKLEREEDSSFRASTLEPVVPPPSTPPPQTAPGMMPPQQAPPMQSFGDDMAGQGGFR